MSKAYDKLRNKTAARKLGMSAAWRKASRAYLTAHPVCVLCGAPSQVTDHIVAHRGREDLFWLESNWQALCAPCHSAKTSVADNGFGNPSRPFKRRVIRGCDSAGNPADPFHVWNRERQR